MYHPHRLNVQSVGCQAFFADISCGSPGFCCCWMENLMTRKKNKVAKGLRAPEKAPQGAGKILEAAETLFARGGYDSVTIQDIAKRSGQSQANVIYHFKSKKELYITILRQARERLKSLFDPSALSGANGDIEEFIRGFAKAHLRMLSRDEKAVRLLYREILGYGPMEGKELAEKVISHDLGCFVDALREVSEKKLIRKNVDPSTLAYLILGINALYIHAGKVVHHLPGGEFASDQGRFQEAVMEIMLHGILKKKK